MCQTGAIPNSVPFENALLILEKAVVFGVASCKSVDLFFTNSANNNKSLEARNGVHVAFGVNFSSSADVTIASAIKSHLKGENL